MRSNILVHLLVVTGIIVCASPQAMADEAKAEELTAEQILDRMTKAYSESHSYQDTGLVETFFIQNNGRRTDRKPFATAFVRPDRFRFEYKAIKAGGDEARHIVWQQGADIRAWWDIRPGVETPGSLKSALASAQGVSSGSSSRIAQLLLPNELGGVFQLGLGNVKRIADEKLGAVDCYRIEGTRPSTTAIPRSKGLDPSQVKATEDVVREALKVKGVSDDVIQKSVQAVRLAQQSPQNAVRGPRSLWIDKATFALRRVDEQTTFETFSTEATTTYEPIFDTAVAEPLLAFNPPER